MTSELATNSMRHAHSDFGLAIHCSQRHIRIEVSDSGQDQPTLRSPTPHERSGRGLRIVQELSDTWGTVPSTNGKTVWFTLPTQTFAMEHELQSAACSDEVPDSGAPGARLLGSAGPREPKGPRGRCFSGRTHGNTGARLDCLTRQRRAGIRYGHLNRTR
jgi:hypothetical protein